MNGDNILPVNVKLPVGGDQTFTNYLNPLPAFSAISKVAFDGGTLVSNGMLTIGQVAVQAPVESVLSSFSLTEEQIKTLVKDSYAFMVGEDAFGNFIELSKKLIFIFNNFGFMNLRKITSNRMYQIVIFLGSPSQGLLYNARLMKKYIDPRSLQPLENVFAAGIKYFERFMEPFFMQNILFGKDPEKWFADFESLTYEAVVTLGKTYDVYSYFSLPTSFGSYKVPCDTYSRCLAALEGDNDALALLAAEIGTNANELKTKLEETNMILQALEVEINHNLTYQPALVIKQVAFRDFIIRNFPNAQQMTLQDIKRQLPVELIENNDCDERTAGAITTGFIDILSSAATTDRPLVKVDEEGFVDLVEFAKLTRHVTSNMKNLADVIKLLMVTASKDALRIMPPPPTDEIFWDEGQMESMIRTLNTNIGFCIVNGPALSGKSARVLGLCHRLPVDRDCVWIDLFKTSNDMEIISRACSQLHLKDCVGKPDFIRVFRSFLSTLNKKSVIVIDNIDGEDENESKTVVDCFISMLLPVLGDYSSKFCIVLISRLSFRMSPFKAAQRIDIGPLDKLARFEMATVNCPEDPVAMIAVSGGLAGGMSVAQRRCSLETLRIVASELSNPLFQNESLVIQEALANDLTSDERLCAACLIKNITPFNEGMAWFVCKEAFHNNIVRWYFAWKILIKRRWVLNAGDLGYIVPADAVVAGVISTSITQEAQWDRYILFWAERLAQVDNAAAVCLTALEDFDNYRSHYKNVFYGFFNKAIDVGTHAKICTDITKVASAISGNISSVLTHRFSADGGVLLAHAIYSCYNISLRGNFLINTIVMIIIIIIYCI